MFAAPEAKGKKLTIEEYNNDLARFRNTMFKTKKKIAMRRYGQVVKQEISIGEMREEGVKGAGEAIQVLEEIGRFLGIHHWVCTGAQNSEASQPAKSVANENQKGL